ncbi:hypothetical protein PQX77_000192 [Marasmius sp. AFHP31]|nr:hypothetical protein PQX77_000192 [Marasmius sp. AFHP31]
MADSDPATKKFQTAFPTLLGLTPQLAALHNSRALKHRSETAVDAPFDVCSQCGAFLYCQTHFGNEACQSTTRLLRTKSAQAEKQRANRVVQNTCGNCGWLTERVVENGNAALFPRRKRGRTSTTRTSLTSSDVKPTILPPVTHQDDQIAPSIPSGPKPLSQQSSSITPAPSSQASRSRPKKKSGLQEMLARNREKEEKQKQSASAQKSQNSGLAAFLSGL